MRDDNDLTTGLGVTETFYKLIEYGFGVKIFLWLVDDERSVIVTVD